MKDYFINISDSNKLIDPHLTILILKILLNFLKFLKNFCYINKFSHTDSYIKQYLMQDKSIFSFLISIFPKLISKISNRFLLLFLEYISEFIEELNGIYFHEFKKLFELPLFIINFRPYLTILSKSNIFIWYFMSNIFLKFSNFVKNENFEFFDFLSVSNGEYNLLILQCFSMVNIVSVDEFMKISGLRFKEENFEEKNENFEKNEKNPKNKIFTPKYFSLNFGRNKKSKFLLSSYHIKIFSNLILIFSNLIKNHQNFLNFINGKNYSSYMLLIKYILIITLINFDSDKFLQISHSRNKFL
jgi:hypothetical protein